MGRRAGLAGLGAALVTAGAWTVPATGGAGAATTQGTLVGEGGDAATPIIVNLIHDDTAGLAPDFGAYTNVDVDQGIADFVGTAPGTFGNDFAVTERPLTTAEAATAQANGRSFAAYAPIAAVPVALMTLVPNSQLPGIEHDHPVTVLPAHTALTGSARRHLRGRHPSVLGGVG